MYKRQSYDSALFESVFSRGDRKLSVVIEESWKNGAKFDAWNECFNFDIWKQAFNETQINQNFYTLRERGENEKLPWDHIDSGVKKEFLFSENLKSKTGELTSDCRQQCYACGIQTCFGINCNNFRLGG